MMKAFYLLVLLAGGIAFSMSMVTVVKPPEQLMVYKLEHEPDAWQVQIAPPLLTRLKGADPKAALLTVFQEHTRFPNQENSTYSLVGGMLVFFGSVGLAREVYLKSKTRKLNNSPEGTPDGALQG